jgi:polyisoprenoid-binding protein YceI
MSTDTLTTSTLPTTGTWVIDPSHSSVDFVAKHLVVSKVRGGFTAVSGRVDVTDPLERSTVDVTIEAASISTNDEQRDAHLVSADFLDVETYPTLRFRSTGAHHRRDEQWTIPGELTIRDVTRPVELDVEYLGLVTDPWGNTKAGFSATTELDRDEFGITWNQALETGGVLVGRKVRIEIDVQLAPEA